MYVKCKFKSAKLPIKAGKDFVINYLDYDKGNKFCEFFDRIRSSEEMIEWQTPIQFSQVSNVLHVLLGERPVPSKRKTLYHRNDYIDSIAENAFIKITSPYYYLDKNEKPHPITEMTRGKKSQYNSTMRGGISFTSKRGNHYEACLTWTYLKKRVIFSIGKYEEIMAKFEEASGIKDIPEKYSLIDFLEYMKYETSQWNDLCTFFKKQKLLGLMLNDKDCSGFNGMRNEGMAKLANNCSMVFKLSLDGEIIFNLTNNDYKVLLKNNKMASFLDGGFLEVVDAFHYLNEDDLLLNGYDLVKNLKK